MFQEGELGGEEGSDSCGPSKQMFRTDEGKHCTISPPLNTGLGP